VAQTADGWAFFIFLFLGTRRAQRERLSVARYYHQHRRHRRHRTLGAFYLLLILFTQIIYGSVSLLQSVYVLFLLAMLAARVFQRAQGAYRHPALPPLFM
jgi:hypothetical protein